MTCDFFFAFSQDCLDFIKSLLQPDPRARPSVRDVLAHHWLSTGQSSSSHRPRTATPIGRLSRMDVDTDIVDLIWNTYGIQTSHVTNSVICKRADEYSAIYYLLMGRRDREDVQRMRREFEDEGGEREGDAVTRGRKLAETGVQRAKRVELDENGNECDKDMFAEMVCKDKSYGYTFLIRL